MSTYVIGDIQGCFDELKQLLYKIQFSSDNDRLWFTGDLVNRGPKSLDTLRYVKSLGSNAITVLGNHDLHMLAIVYGLEKPRPKDTFEEILVAEDKQELVDWICEQPLLYSDIKNNYHLTHAGIYPEWSIEKACTLAREVESVLKSDQLIPFLSNMYGNQPDKWDESLSGWERLRFITNCFTRMRYCTSDFRLNLKSSVSPGEQDSDLHPWYTLRQQTPDQSKIFFGHWSTLGLLNNNEVFCLDSGCLWGGEMTALKITDDFEYFKIDCAGEQKPF